MPKISIIIPAYNEGEYIKECLDSILNQTFTDYEVIVVDDCSTDNTYSIIQSYIPKFNNKLTLLKTDKNSGWPAQPRNMGLPLAKGDYIYFLDGDGYIANNALEILFNTAKEYNADVVHTSAIYRQSRDRWIKTIDKQRYDTKESSTFILPKDELVRLYTYGSRQISWKCATKLIKRNIIVDNNISFKPYLFEDYLFTYELLYYSNIFVVIPNALSYHTNRPTSIIHSPLYNNTAVTTWLPVLYLVFNNFVEFFNKINLKDDKFFLDTIFKIYNSSNLHSMQEQKHLNKKEIFDKLYGYFKDKQSNDLNSVLYSILISELSTNKEDR